MSKHNAFNNIVYTLSDYKRPEVTQSEYELFQKQWIFDAVGGKRFGESFCDFFKLGSNTPLYWFKKFDTSKDWIEKNYIIK